MVWWYGKQLVSEEDFKMQAKPKKYICYFGLVWVLIGGGLQYVYKKNPETIFKQFLLSYRSVIYFTLPLPAIYYSYRWQQNINADIYQRTVGHLTDIQLFELDVKYNPSRRVIYERLLPEEILSKI